MTENADVKGEVMDVFRREVTVDVREVDLFRRLKLSELFRIMEQTAIAHTEVLNVGRAQTFDRGIFWALLLESVRIRRLPVYGEKIVILTWPGRTMHLFFPRFFRFETPEGEELLSTASFWGLVDASERKMVGPDRLEAPLPAVVTGREIPLPRKPKALPVTEETRFRVPFSYCDVNGHMNNTRYLDLVQDVTGAENETRVLTGLDIEYVNEVRPGEVMTVGCGEEGDSVYVRGDLGEKNIFRVRLTYGEEERP